MPELPDVEAHRRTLVDHATGQRVGRISVRDPELLHGTTPQGLGRSLVGRTVGRPRRHGKWLFVRFDDGPALVFHFRMTGELRWQPGGAGETDDAVSLHLEHGALSYRSKRRLGGISYLAAGRDVSEVTGRLGPDATEVDRERLGTLLRSRRGGLKSALMDQRLMAGLGNELVDEILWRSRLHPTRPAAAVDDGELAELDRQLRQVLRRSIRAGHVPSGPSWLNGRRDEARPVCPRCEAPLERATVAGRTTYWCPQEQRD